MTAVSPLVSGILFLGFLVIYLVYQVFTSPKARYPPGPRPYPIIGNLLDVPPKYQEKVFANLAKKYGDVMHLSIFGKNMVILTSLEAAQELLKTRSAIYSDRPRFVLLAEMMGWERTLTFLPHGDLQRKHTRLVHEGLNQAASQSFRQLREYEAAVLLQGMTANPDTFRSHIRRYTASLILKLAYGHRVTSMDDEYVQVSETAVTRTIESGSPGSMPVDIFPALKYLPTWIPGMDFKRNALSVCKDVRKMEDMLFKAAKENMEYGSTTSSFVASLIESHTHDGQMSGEDELDIKGAAGVLYGASIDTTTSALETFILAMLHHPDVYCKAQEEIDRVIGYERLPELADRDSLPYFEAVIMELYRWHPPLPLGVPHVVIKDDLYHGYHIPKGALVIANVWAITQNPTIYDKPQSFCPERFIDSKQPDPREIVFGFGRRICPGKDFGDTNVWLAAVSITASFQISSPLSGKKNGDMDYPMFSSGFISHPRTFECLIKPRFGKTLDLIVQTSADRKT